MRHHIIPVTPFQQNCSLIWCEETKRAALIDPGGESDRLLWAIEQEGVSVERLLLTHGHIDHVAAAPMLAKALGVPIEGPHRLDAFWLDGLPKQAHFFGLPHADPFTPDRWLESGEEVSVGNLRLTVLHTPGHTPGHIALAERSARVVFVGDLLFAGSIGRTDFPGGNQHELIESIHHQLYPLGDDFLVIPGHGPTTTIGHERQHNPFAAAPRR